ncbi:MAG: M23 family metallopeptidase [Armatimonadota bacterium]|nr:M23 family metallopeptidase [Armatimonadota bacterium]
MCKRSVFLHISILLAVLLVFTKVCAKTTSTGFYYPTGTDSPKLMNSYSFGAGPDNQPDRWACGVPIKAKTGAAVYAVASGEVVKVSPSGWGDGNVALIMKHIGSNGRGFVAVYGCVRNYVTGRVNLGQRIGVVGPNPGGSYLHLGIFESPDGSGALPFVRSQEDYKTRANPLPRSLTVDTVLSYNGWLSPIDFLQNRNPKIYGNTNRKPEVEVPSRPKPAEPESGVLLSSIPAGRGVTFRVDAGSGAIPNAYRFKVWQNGGREWVSEWISGSGSASWDTVLLEPGTYWWEAQARNEIGESLWLESRRRFYVNYPPGIPPLVAPTPGEALNSRKVMLIWSDPGDADDMPHYYRDYRVIVSGDWSYDSYWGYRATSMQITVPTDGNYNWKVAASDGLDQSGFSPERQFLVDTVPPVIAMSGPPTSRWSNIGEIAWNATDATSGVEHVTLQWEPGGQVNVPPAGSAPIPQGQRRVTIKAADRAGNISTEKSGPYWVDVTPPHVSMTIAPAQPNGIHGGYATSATLIVTADDGNGSGIAETRYILDGYERTYSGSVTITGAGLHTFSAKALDNAGNTFITPERNLIIEHPQGGESAPTPVPPPDFHTPKPETGHGESEPARVGF